MEAWAGPWCQAEERGLSVVTGWGKELDPSCGLLWS